MTPSELYDLGFRNGFDDYQRGARRPSDLDMLDVRDPLQAGYLGGWDEAEMLRRAGIAYQAGGDVAADGLTTPCPYAGDEQQRLREEWIAGWTAAAVIFAHRILEVH